MDNFFWIYLDRIIDSHELVVDRKKGSRHPLYPDMIYPLDYGYLKKTRSMDGGGIDVWIGSQNRTTVNGIFCTVDIKKEDSEIKIVIGCNSDEIKQINEFHNDSFQAAIWIEKQQ